MDSPGAVEVTTAPEDSVIDDSAGESLQREADSVSPPCPPALTSLGLGGHYSHFLFSLWKTLPAWALSLSPTPVTPSSSWTSKVTCQHLRTFSVIFYK